MSKVSKKPSLRQKFSFDLHNLKLGASKSESNSSHHHIPTHAVPRLSAPRSVRPSLSPKVDEQLRLACSNILQDLPVPEQSQQDWLRKEEDARLQSYHQICSDRTQDLLIIPRANGSGGSTKENGRTTKSVPIGTKTMPTQIQQRRIEQAPVVLSNLEDPEMKPTIKSQTFFEGFHLDAPPLQTHAGSEREGQLETHEDQDFELDDVIHVDLSSFNPPMTSPAFETATGDPAHTATAFASPEPLPPLEAFQIVEQKFTSPHIHCLSPPTHSRNTSIDPPNAPTRVDSVETTSSIPWTEGTGHSRKASTAPTSTNMTPSISSLRTSSQAANSSSEKPTAVDVERLLHAFEAKMREQQGQESQTVTNIPVRTTSIRAKQIPAASPQSFRPSPLLRANTDGQLFDTLDQAALTRKRTGSIQERRNVTPVPYLSSIRSRESSRPESRKKPSTPRSESIQELDLLRTESRQSQHIEALQGATDQPSSFELNFSMPRQSTERSMSRNSERSRASSKSRRLFQIHGPSDLEGSRPGSRARTAEPSDGKDSTNGQPAYHRKSQSSLNLNRDLPPLPGLDQWQSTETEKPKHVSALVSPKIDVVEEPQTDTFLSEPSPVGNADGLSPGLAPPSATSSCIHSIYSRYSKIPDDWSPDDDSPYTPLPADSDYIESATTDRFDFVDCYADPDPLPTPPAQITEVTQRRIPSEYMFRPNFGAVTSPMMPPPIPFEPRPQPDESKRKTEDMFLPDLDARARTASNDQSMNEPPKRKPSAPFINYSRSLRKQPTGLRKPNLMRSQTEISAPMEQNKSLSHHTKSTSEQINFSRKPSTDNYAKLYELGYRDIVQIQPRQGDVQAPTRSLSKRWWKRGTSKREKSIPDQGVESSGRPSFVMMDRSAAGRF